MAIAVRTSCGSVRAVKRGVCLVLSVVVACGGGRSGSQPDAQGADADAGAGQPDAGTPVTNACATTLGLPNVPTVVGKSSLYAFATADFDSDGKLDVAFPDDVSVRIAKGKGNGTYETPIAIASNADANLVHTIAVGDLSGDGKLDILYGGFGTSLRVLTNTGGLTFAAPVAYDMTVLPYEVELRDMNSDGRLDIVALDRHSNEFSIRLATSTGFASGVKYPASTIVETSVHFALGDINGDSKPDAVVGTGRADGFYTLLNNGSGGFGAPTLHEIGLESYDVAVEDVNGDGSADIVITHDDHGYVSVFLNDGTGGFATETKSTLGRFLRSPYIALGDIDGDHNTDAVVASNDDVAGLVVLLGTGTGTFAMPMALSATSAEQIALADTNGDDKLDILVAGSDRLATWLHTNSASLYATPQAYRVQFSEFGVQSMQFLDIDNVPGPELVMAYAPQSGPKGMLDIRKNVGGTFAMTLPATVTQRRPSMTITADVNGDMRADLVVLGLSDSDGVGEAFLNRNGTLTAAPAFVASHYSPVQFQAVDVNEDGKLDLVIATLFSIDVYLGHGDGSFAAGTSVWTATSAAAYGAVVGDFDRDGHVDLVVNGGTFNSGSSLEFRKGAGDGSFAAPVGSGPTPNAQLEARDLNHDGRLDLVEYHTGSMVAVRLGQGDGRFGARLESDAFGIEKIALADVDGDGNVDVVATSERRSINVLLGNGDGTLKPTLQYEATAPESMAIADTDGDGRLDIAVNVGIDELRGDADVRVLAGRCLP